MRVGLISDIHGNLTALDTVLADLERETPDRVFCLGDVIALGPQPLETLERLRELDYPTVMGNTDSVLLSPIAGDEPVDDHMRRILDLYLWCYEQLSAEDSDYLRQFQPILEFDLGSGNTLLCFHGSPRSFDEVIVDTTAKEDLDHMFSGYDVTVMAGGHTHNQLIRQHDKTTVLNPGSVGLDYPHQAEYALIDSTDKGLSIELRRLELNREELGDIARDNGMPHAEWWSQDNRWANW